MKKTVTVIEQRPNYFRGQLLLEDDFLTEQNYHTNARCRHNLNLHGWGVVRGYEIMRKTANSITIKAGYAIDETGQEIFLDESKEIELSGFAPNELLRVSLNYEEANGSEDEAGLQKNRRDCYASISVSKSSEYKDGLILATIQLNGQGKLNENAINYSQTKYVRILAPGSITSDYLHESLKRGWLRLPFRPYPLVEWQTEKKGVPPFRVGATEALSPDPKEAGEKDRGAAGTMAIPVPPGATHITRLRIAGKINEGGINLQLFTGGWDWINMKHLKKNLLKKTITSSTPFLKTFEIDGKVPKSSEYQTLSIRLEGAKRTSISLIAIEFAYY